MKAAEFISKTKEGYEGMEPSLATIYFDLVDAISEGCIEGVEAYKPGPKCMRVKCEDGIVWIWPGLRFETAMDCKCVTRKTSTGTSTQGNAIRAYPCSGLRNW